MYRQLIYPFLEQVDAEKAHSGTIRLLEIAQNRAVGRTLLRLLAGNIPPRPVALWGLDFPNPLGVAAGFDKDIRVTRALELLGFGHIEVGTITPHPQVGNPKPRIFRLPEDRALINRMGFPNCGLTEAVERLSQIRDSGPNSIIGVSLGKQKETPLEAAADDYKDVMTGIYSVADYLTVNVSSPNTQGLRRLQSVEFLDNLLKKLTDHSALLAKRLNLRTRPLLLKISPDLTYAEIDAILDSALRHGVHGILAVNTTVTRDGLSSQNYREIGGLSGMPLAQKSHDIVTYISRRVQGQLVVVGAGGIFTAEHVSQMLESGASLVQLYTGLVYEGPALAGRIMRAL